MPNGVLPDWMLLSSSSVGKMSAFRMDSRTLVTKEWLWPTRPTVTILKGVKDDLLLERDHYLSILATQAGPSELEGQIMASGVFKWSNPSFLIQVHGHPHSVLFRSCGFADLFSKTNLA